MPVIGSLSQPATTGACAQQSTAAATTSTRDPTGTADGLADSGKKNQDWKDAAAFKVGARVMFKTLGGGWAYFNGSTAVYRSDYQGFDKHGRGSRRGRQGRASLDQAQGSGRRN